MGHHDPSVDSATYTFICSLASSACTYMSTAPRSRGTRLLPKSAAPERRCTAANGVFEKREGSPREISAAVMILTIRIDVCEAVIVSPLRFTFGCNSRLAG